MTREELLSAADTLSRVGAEHDAVTVRRAIAKLDNWKAGFEMIEEAAQRGESLEHIAALARDIREGRQ